MVLFVVPAYLRSATGVRIILMAHRAGAISNVTLIEPRGRRDRFSHRSPRFVEQLLCAAGHATVSNSMLGAAPYFSDACIAAAA